MIFKKYCRVLQNTYRSIVGWELGFLMDWLSTVLRPAQELLTYVETSPLPVKGCTISTYMFSAQGLLIGRDFYYAIPVVTRGFGFFCLFFFFLFFLFSFHYIASYYPQGNCLFIYCFTSHSRIFHLCGDVTVVGEGLLNLDLCSALRAFERGGNFIVPRLFWHRVSFSSVSYQGLPLTTHEGMWRTYSNLDPYVFSFSRFSRHTRGCRGPILTRILRDDL
jgi:hypothetical protein